MRRKRLTIVYHFRVRGTGAEGVHIAGIVNGFRSLGHKVMLVSPTNVDPTKSRSLARPFGKNDKGITKILHKMADTLPQPFFELMEIAYNTVGVARLHKVIKKYGKVDIIYERYAFFNFAGALVSKMKRIPLIIEVNELSGLKRVRGQYFVRLCSFIERRILRQARLVVVVSEFLNKEVHERIHPAETRVLTVPNGVPEEWKKRNVSAEAASSLRNKYDFNNKKVICFVGGLVEWHNFGLLLQAFKRVITDGYDCVLMFVGEGPMREYILDKARELGIDSNILLVGNVPHEEIPVYLASADILVIPETNEFRSPIKLFEYMAAGKPVVAPKKAGIEAIITHGVDGFMFEPGNASSFADAMMRILQNETVALKLGKNARKNVFANYTWEKHSKLILDEFFNAQEA